MLRSRLVTALFASAALSVGAEARGQTSPTVPATDAAGTPPDPPRYNPAAEADPPLLAPPNAPPEALGPLSTSGTDVQGATAGPAAAAARPDPTLEARIAALEAELARRRDREPSVWRHLRIGGFVQPQLVVATTNAAGSPNRLDGALPAGIGANDVIARPDGTTTNGTAFRLRRTRLRATYETDVARFYVQLEALPLTGEAPSPSTVVRNAEATGKIRWSSDVRTEITAGLFMVPFRYELVETSNVRPFAERTTLVRAMFPLERDLGVHARTTALRERLVIDVAVVNGQRLGEPKFVVQPDLNRSKDVVLWVSYRLPHVQVGTNGYLGRGQIVDGQNLRFKQFDRWAFNVFLAAEAIFTPRLGATRLVSELMFGANMDPGILYPTAAPTIPAAFAAPVDDVHQRAFYARLEQELGSVALAGYRFDVYHPRASGPGIATGSHTVLAGARFSRNLRWTNELTYASTDPTDATSLAFASTVQAQF